jgi:hypothetical protein
MDYADDMAASEQIGMEKVAINMIKDGEDDSKIMKHTGIELDAIKKLRAEAAKG